MVERIVPQEESRFAQMYLERLQAEDLDHIRAHLLPRVSERAKDEQILTVAGYFPEGERLSTSLIGSEVTMAGNQWRGNFTFEYRFTSGWALANIVVCRTDHGLAVLGFHVYRTTASQQEINQFTLIGKSAMQYAVLILSVLAPVFVLATAWVCLRTSIPKRKWLWVVFVLLGVGSISVNWTTGQFAVQPLAVKLLSASAFSAGPFSPWIISVSVPLGAILFWLRREGLLAQRDGDRIEDPSCQ